MNMRNAHVMSSVMTKRSLEQTDSPPWKMPVQARSRARVAAILDAALAHILRNGHLDLKVTHVASEADVPIGSLYQFFPNRDALISGLYAREMASIDTHMRKSLRSAQSIDQLLSGIHSALKTQLKLVRRRPGLAFIWASASSHPAIQDSDAENTKRNAIILRDRLAELGKRPVDDTLSDAALIICHLWGSVIQLCLRTTPQQASRLLEAYAQSIETRLREILDC